MTERLGDRYVLGEIIGTGGGSTVRLAVDELLDRTVAVKMINDAAASTADPVGRQRFLHEARSLARFDHPNLVRIFDAGETDGMLFMVMEYVDGGTVAQLIAERAPLPTSEAADIVEHVLAGLSAVHEAGVVHRDVKPANVLIDRSRHVVLTDFGIAKQLDDIEQSLTAAGMVVGTPAYLPPEQAAGGEVGPWTDIYAVGLLLRDLVAATPGPLSAVAERATRHVPTERFQTAAEMAEAVRAANRQETAVMPAGVLGSEHTRILATDGPSSGWARADDATSVMASPGGGTVRHRHTPTVRAASTTPPKWFLPALVIAIVGVVLTAGAIASRDESLFQNLQAPPTTAPIIVPVTAPLVATTTPAAPVVDTSPPQPGEGDQPAGNRGDDRGNGNGGNGDNGGNSDGPDKGKDDKVKNDD